ncbi:MAG: dihydroorotase [Actinomycetota bacterium]|nr:dihydroorotase [Actinomycetota bacterium]
MTTSIDVPTPDDWHVHLRDGSMLAAVVAHTARRYRYALVMPNLRPPVTSTSAAIAYRDRVLAHAPADAGDFRPVIALYLNDDLDPADLAAAKDSGVVPAVKYYPAGATTNSDQASGTLADFLPVLEQLAEVGLRLCVHAESTDPAVDLFDREAVFLERELAPVCERLPELAVTVEHVSTRAGVAFTEAHPQVAATITPHHLACDRGDLLADGLRPDLYCKPVVNSPDDRRALVAAATGDSPKFCLGTDSAPHPTTAKYGPKGAAGVFNAPYGLEVAAEVFRVAGRLDRLAAFVSTNGCAIYGVEPSDTRLTLTHTEADTAPPETLTTADGDEVVMFGVDEARQWTVAPGA